MKNILLAEDSLVAAEFIQEFLSANGYNIDVAENGKDALDMFSRGDYSIVITDLEMPVMGGEELIAHLNAEPLPPIIFVMTSHYEPEMIVNIMKLGVYDYLHKPINRQDLLIKLTHALESYELKRTRMMIEKEKTVRLEDQLSWYRWQDRAQSTVASEKGKTLFDDMHRAFNQSVGMGSVIYFLDSLVDVAREQNDGYLVPKDMFELIRNTTSAAKHSMDMMREMNDIQNREPQRQSVSLQAIRHIVSEEIAVCRKFEAIKNTPIMFNTNELSPNLSVFVDPENIRKIINELIINAMKFSVKEGSVHVIVKSEDTDFVLYVLNEPVLDSMGNKGIPVGYETLIFEPFYRLNKTVQDEYKTLDYGLGLSMVDVMSHKNDVKIEIAGIKDFTDLSRGEVNKVMAVMRIPIVKSR